MFGENSDVGRGEGVGWDLLGSPREWAPLGKSLSDSSPPRPHHFFSSVHPYEVAEVIALPVEQGNSPYLHWVRQVTESVADSSTVLP